MCNVKEFIEEQIAGGLPGGDHSADINCVYVGALLLFLRVPRVHSGAQGGKAHLGYGHRIVANLSLGVLVCEVP